MLKEFNPTILLDLDQYTYKARGRSAEIFIDSEGIALKLYENRFPIDTALFEYKVLKCLKSKSILCPQLINSVQFQDRFGFRYPWINGDCFQERFGKQFWNLKYFAHVFSDLHLKIHQIEGFEDLPNQWNYYRNFLVNQSNLKTEDQTRLIDQLSEMPIQNLLCHGDFDPKNTIINQNTAYIIDWQNAYRGDPLGDVAKTWVTLSFYAFYSDKTNYLQKLWLRRLCRCYLNEYSKKKKINTSELFQWIAIVAGIQTRTLEKPKQHWYQHLIDTFFMDLNQLKKYVIG